MATMPGRLEKLGDPMAPVLREAIDIESTLSLIERKVSRAR